MLIQRLDRLACCVNRALFLLATACCGLMALPTVADVLTRAVSGRSLLGVLEIVESLLMIMIFGTLGTLSHARKHLRVELLTGRFPKSVRLGLELAASLLGLLFFGSMGRCLWIMAHGKILAGETSLMLGIPTGWLQMFAASALVCVCLSLLVLCLQYIAQAIKENAPAIILVGLGLTIGLAALPFALRFFIANSPHLMSFGAWTMLFLLAMLFLGLPIGLVMAGVGYLGLASIYSSLGPANMMLAVGPYSAATNYSYSVIPMFILMGELALCAGISADLFKAANLWLGRLPGGLAIATVAGCAGFAAVSGDSMATAMTMAAVALPEMERHKYDPGLACATLAAGGTLGILIPPSTGFIFYSLVTEESVGKLFVAGIIPGLLLALLFCLMLYVFALRRPDLAPRGLPAPLRERLASLWGILPMLALIFLIIGGILLGWFNPNEGGAVGAVATALYGLARRRLNLRVLGLALTSAVMVTTRLLFILMGVSLLSAFLAATTLPAGLAEFLINLNVPRGLLLALIVVFYILLGCIMNVVPMILLTLPTIFPAVTAIGTDPLWFGVIVVIMMEMGQITPPVGLNTFAMSAVAPHVPIQNIFRRITPFFLAMLTLVALLGVCPALATWLPGILFK